jgi:hypothetical protein
MKKEHRPLSEETKQKISVAKKGHPRREKPRRTHDDLFAAITTAIDALTQEEQAAFVRAAALLTRTGIFLAWGKIVDAPTLELLRQACNLGLGELFDFCLGAPLFDGTIIVTEKTLKAWALRFVSVAWLMHSEMLVGVDGRPLTLAQLAALRQLNCSRCALSLTAQRFAAPFRFRTRIQKRSDRSRYASSAKSGWEKRRAREAAEARVSHPHTPATK